MEEISPARLCGILPKDTLKLPIFTEVLIFVEFYGKMGEEKIRNYLERAFV